jgi:hypothetical protein
VLADALEKVQSIFREWVIPHMRPDGPAPKWATGLSPQNTGYQPMLHYAVASPLRVHGDGSERSLESPKNNLA